MWSPLVSSSRRLKTAAPFLVLTWPLRIDGPTSPGRGLLLYQPVMLGLVSGGVASAPVLASPSGLIFELTLIFGILIRVGLILVRAAFDLTGGIGATAGTAARGGGASRRAGVSGAFLPPGPTVGASLKAPAFWNCTGVGSPWAPGAGPDPPSTGGMNDSRPTMTTPTPPSEPAISSAGIARLIGDFCGGWVIGTSLRRARPGGGA